MKRKHFDHFNIAGFAYYEGAIAFNNLKTGTKLKLKPEKDNRYDENAVAIYYKKQKLGFVPANNNKPIATILNAGYNIFEIRVQQIIHEAHPNRQIHVVAFILEKNKGTD
jgi:hypothetical protein